MPVFTSLLTGKVLTMEWEKRFWDKVKKGSGCWIWMSCKFRYGYGYMRVGGKNRSAHRLSWELHNGPILNGMLVCHHCDTPLCVNPNHLFLGTPADNARDRDTKGRQGRGEKVNTNVLSPEDVRAIRGRLAIGDSQKVIAVDYGISQVSVSAIKLKKSWAWLQ